MSAMTLLGLGDDKLTSEIDGFLLSAPKPSSTDVANFLKVYALGARPAVAQALIARGVPPTTIANALRWLDAEGKWNLSAIKGVLTVVAAGASAFHGYRRNRGSIGWTIGWFLMGLTFPVISTAVSFAQGFGKAK